MLLGVLVCFDFDLGELGLLSKLGTEWQVNWIDVNEELLDYHHKQETRTCMVISVDKVA